MLRSHVQEQFGVTAAEREAETDAAMRVLGCTWEQWPFRDDAPDWAAAVSWLAALSGRYERVYAPAPEPKGGHAHHDALGVLADSVFGIERVTRYLTYTSGGKSTDGVPVPYEDGWPELKLRALLCYRSQLARPAYAEHFLRAQDEWYERR